MEWGVTVAIVAISLILMWVLDLRKESRLKKGGIQVLVQKKLWRKRAVYRRFAYLILMIFYVPVTTSAIQSFSCTAGLYPESLTLHRGQGLFLYDMRINCDEVGFSAMNSLITLIMVAHTCLLPLLVLFFTLRQKKWGFLQCKMIQYGPVYETYKERWCFWETLVMLRKIVYILLTNTYPISPVYQAIGHLCVTGTFLLATVIFRPFRKFTWNRQMLRMLSPSIIFEVLSNFSLILLETQGLLIAYGITVPALDAAFVISLAVALVCWLTIILAVEYEKNLAVFEDFEVPLVEKRSLFLVEEDNSQSKDAARRRIDEVRLLGTRVQPVGSGNHPDASASRSKGLTHKNGQARKLYATRERENKSVDKIALGLKGHDNTVEKSQEKLHKRPWNANDPEKDAEKRRQAVGEVKAFEKTLEHQKKRAGETKAPETSVVTEEDNEQKHVKSQDELLLVLDVDSKEPFTSSHVPVPSDQQINSRKGGREGTPDPPENLFDDSSNTSLF
ncbi:uncharacterized protein LOC135471350 [Liolophura sinensis]|uniref:uncharacterized protein LOC135471350 n=1 Tax=Liolophura sinensis TaxID=3198878 RepID=UPI00315878FD